MSKENSLLEPIGILVEFGKTKVRLYVPKEPIPYSRIVAEAKRLGIYKEYSKKYARKLIDKLGLTPDVSKNGGPIHYSYTPIKTEKAGLYCFDTWHPVHDGGKQTSNGCQTREMHDGDGVKTGGWTRDSGGAFLFKFKQ